MDNPRLVHGNAIPTGIPWETSHGMGRDRHKLLCDGNGTDKYVPRTTLHVSMWFLFIGWNLVMLPLKSGPCARTNVIYQTAPIFRVSKCNFREFMLSAEYTLLSFTQACYVVCGSILRTVLTTTQSAYIPETQWWYRDMSATSSSASKIKDQSSDGKFSIVIEVRGTF